MIGNKRVTAPASRARKSSQWWLALVLVLMATISGCSDAGGEIDTLGARQAWEMAKEHPGDVIVLDVRTRAEVSRGMIPNAQWIDFHGSRFRQNIAELDRKRTYLVYCHSGTRSAATISMMRAMGFSDVRHLGGGIVEWLREGLPLERAGRS